MSGFRPSRDRAGEEWPVWNGRPLLFVGQMSLTYTPAAPALLKGIAMLTFFVSPEPGTLERENGAD